MKKCIITIRDEVTCKLDGLEPSDRRTLLRRFEFEIPGARYLPSVKLGRWNGKVSYFSLAGSTYINLLPEIVEYLDNNGYDVELNDGRNYTTTFTFNTITAETFANKTWPKGHPIEGQPIVLRDYQIAIINQFLENPQSMQEIATGAGKTIITAALSWSIEPHGRSVVVVPNKSLVTQTEADYKNLGLDVGVYFGERKEIGRKHTICTWQSLNNMLKNTKSGEAEVPIDEFLEDVVCIMIDEAHQAKAEALKSLLSTVMSQVPIRWGLTGTVPKDKYASTALHVCIGPVINKLAARELQDQGVLAQCHVNVVQLQDQAEFSNYQTELKYLLENKPRLDKLAQLINTIKETGNTLVLVDRVAAGTEIVARLPGSVFISGDTKLTERKEEYDEIATVDGKIIVATYQVAAVGINIPRIFNLVMVEGGKSFVRVIQSIGRGIRKAEDKDFVQIWDITSTCKFSKRHLTERKKYYTEAGYPFSIEKLHYR